MLIIGASGSRKTNELLNLIKEQDSKNLIDKIYLCAKDLKKPKCQFLIKKHEDVGMKYLNDPKAFKQYSQCMDDVKIILMIITQIEKKVLIVFDDMIADIMTNKKFEAIIKELFTR